MQRASMYQVGFAVVGGGYAVTESKSSSNSELRNVFLGTHSPTVVNYF